MHGYDIAKVVQKESQRSVKNAKFIRAVEIGLRKRGGDRRGSASVSS